MKWTRQRCQEAPSTLAAAALSPSWASEMTSLTPRRPRRASLRRNSRPERLGLRGTDIQAQHLAPAIAVDADGDDDGGRDDAAAPAHLQIGRVEPDIGPIAFDRAAEEGLDLLVDLLAQPADLALGDAVHAHGLNQLIDRAGRDALDVGLLHHRRDGLLRHPARLEKAREVAALAQLRDAQFHRSGAGFPVAVAVAIALHQALGRSLAMGGAGAASRYPTPSGAGRQSRSSHADNSASGVFSKSA